MNTKNFLEINKEKRNPPIFQINSDYLDVLDKSGTTVAPFIICL